MKIEILKSEIIKPSSPTPENLRSYKLSVMDQLALPVYTPVVLFYPAAPAEASEKLKKSLSETLTHFYPLAGRIKDNIISIECNDDGAIYVEARVHGVLLSDFLQQPDAAGLKHLLPIDYSDFEEAVTGPILEVQANSFQCGGLAIGVCMSHTLADASTLSTFIRVWAAITRHDELTPSLLPHFETTAFRFPEGREISVHKPRLPKPDEKVDFTKRFVFDASKLASLKAKVSSETVQQPTRFEALTALIARCAKSASIRSNSNLKHHLVSFSADIRKRVEPPFPENTIGNYSLPSTIQPTTKTTTWDGDTNTDNDSLKDLVGELRMGIKEFCESKARKLGSRDPDDAYEVLIQNSKEFGEFRRSKMINDLYFTSWCNYKFYEADFGWNRPSWVGTVPGLPNNFVRLMETRDGGGVEAWVTLNKQAMALFESHPQLLLFASLNPSVSL